MNNDFLSQEEIDALLSKAANDEADMELDDGEKDILGEIGNISMGSAATTLSILINQPVSITTPRVSITTLSKLKDTFEVPNIAIEVKFLEGLSGVNLLVLKEIDAGVIADLMMGGQGVYDGGTLSEIHMSAVSEAMNQMIGTAATSMAQMFSKEVNISPPDAFLWDDKAQKLSNMVDENEPIVKVAFRLTVGNLIDSEIMQLLPTQTAREIIDAMTAGYHQSPVEPEPPKKAEEVKPKNTESKVSDHELAVNEIIEEVPVHKAEFIPFEKEKVEPRPKNIDLILDVPIEVSVILGRTKKTIKDILELSNGSLIELDKLVEEPVEILVNGKIVAQGEVVVVNENFGVRITNIVSSADRVRKLRD